MNIEENKAIEWLKLLVKTHKLKTQEVTKDEVLLNLIEKQQKEIEEKTTIILAGAEKVKMLEKEIEELKEINKEHQLLNGELGFKIGTLESEIEEKTKLINSMKKFLLDIGLMSDYLESEGKI